MQASRYGAVAAIWSAFWLSFRRCARRAKSSRAIAASLMMSIVAVPFFAPAHARQVTVTMTGYVTSGLDVTGVFGGGKNVPLANANFTLVYSIQDNNGQPCGGGASCIEASATSYPITMAKLMIMGNGFSGSFDFLKTLLTYDVSQIVERQLTGTPPYNNALLTFRTNQYYNAAENAGDGGSSRILTQLSVELTPLIPVSLNPCWEEELIYETYSGDNKPFNQYDFFINNVNTKDEHTEEAYGNFDIRMISIMPTTPPPVPSQCFVGSSR